MTITLITLATVFILEITFRFFLQERLSRREHPLIYSSDPIRGYEYIPNSSGTIKRFGINKKIKINDQGTIGNSFNKHKDNNTFRIIVIGSTPSTGILMQGESAYPELLNNKFKENGLRVEVLNLSLDGRYRDYSNFEFVKRKLFEFNPDLVLFKIFDIPTRKTNIARDIYKSYVIEYSIGSTDDFEKCKRDIDVFVENKLLDSIYTYSFTFRFFTAALIKIADIFKINLKILNVLEGYITKIYKSSRISISRYSKKENLDLLKELNSFILNHKTEVVFYNYMYHKGVESTFKNLKIQWEYLDVDVHKYSSKYAHNFNPEGHLLVSNRFYDILLEKYIPKKYTSAIQQSILS